MFSYRSSAKIPLWLSSMARRMLRRLRSSLQMWRLTSPSYTSSTLYSCPPCKCAQIRAHRIPQFFNVHFEFLSLKLRGKIYVAVNFLILFFFVHIYAPSTFAAGFFSFCDSLFLWFLWNFKLHRDVNSAIKRYRRGGVSHLYTGCAPSTWKGYSQL